MIRQIKALLYFFVADFRFSFLIFWTILSATVVISLGATYYLQDVENSSMYLAISGAIYVYGAILGFITVRESLTFALKMGGTRKSYFVAVGAFFLGLSVVMAILDNLYHVIIMAFVNNVGLDIFTLIHPAMILGEANSIWYRFSIDVFVIFLLMSIFYFLGLVFHKYNLIGGYVVIGVVALVLFISSAAGVLLDLLQELFVNPSFNHYVIAFVIGIVLYLTSWLLVYNIPAKSARAS
ncbi:hypothetical protein NC661_15170 [Aquibacillus koreensis]|uniref:Uncharacterized protein n=1 Tax=Aquibacillus koreensis TaxID=279446 RepID=A0A9X3WKZ8_9BACI|nr:hypothetical protein [Aquibacillus koreensis]MCT2534405.1 hypothetical protein [Aquibacillus koreensis]MDC3421712.1 hypothetical protein [Aquibacillus koreensis]